MKTPKTSVRIEAGLSADAQIEQQLRQQILRGKLSPGDKLPPTPMLAKKWRVSCTVVQKAMVKLAASGFVERRPRQGTFIKRATDRGVIGVLFGPNLTEESAHFYRAVLRAIRQQIGEYSWSCRDYDGLTGSRGLPLPTDAEAIRHLTSDLRNHAFKGLIEVSPGVRGMGDWEHKIDLPKVVYELPPAASDVQLDTAFFASESVNYLAQRGCTKLTYLRASWHLSSRSADLEGLFDAASTLHLPTPQVESFLLTEQGGNVEREVFAKMQQLLKRWKNSEDKPDGLLVGDDITMRAVALALVHAGIKIPDAMHVVTMANDGVDLHYGVPVARFEFSVGDVARQLLSLLWKRMTDEPLPNLPILIGGKIRESQAASRG